MKKFLCDKMSKLETKICGRKFYPFYGNAAADYTRVLGIGNEVKDYEIFSELQKEGLLGFVSTKTLTTESRAGNPEPRFAWTDDFRQGIQSMGLPNIGLYSYPFEKCDVPTIVSYVGKNKEEAKTMTLFISEKAKKNSNIEKVEYNVTCPNAKGFPSCYKKDSIEHLKVIRENTGLPVFAKIGYFPEEDKLIEFGKKLEDIGINGVTAINSPPGMGIDFEARSSVVKKYGGVFGKGLKPLALRTISILHENTNLDKIGLSGVYKYSDAIEFLLAGANAVEICSALISEVYPKDNETVIDEKTVEYSFKSFLEKFKNDTENFMERKKLKYLSEIIGKIER